jgi:hypothetical protein
MSTSAIVNSSWLRVGEIASTALVDTRLQLHHAVQIAVSAAISYVAARVDDSHTALAWLPSSRALVTESIVAERDVRIGVRLEDLTLQVLGADRPEMEPFGLQGRTTTEAYSWLSQAVALVGLDSARLNPRKHYTIPAHAVAGGAPFSPRMGNELMELSRYWSNAADVIDDTVRATPGASAVRTWPHHFDIATLVALPDTGPGGPSGRRTIGVGQSPGDDSYAEPYWYVGPYPYPSTREFPPVAGGGHWHTNGWIGAVLPASGFVAASDQRAHLVAFIDSAVAGCRRLLDG